MGKKNRRSRGGNNRYSDDYDEYDEYDEYESDDQDSNDTDSSDSDSGSDYSSEDDKYADLCESLYDNDDSDRRGGRTDKSRSANKKKGKNSSSKGKYNDYDDSVDEDEDYDEAQEDSDDYDDFDNSNDSNDSDDYSNEEDSYQEEDDLEDALEESLNKSANNSGSVVGRGSVSASSQTGSQSSAGSSGSVSLKQSLMERLKAQKRPAGATPPSSNASGSGNSFAGKTGSAAKPAIQLFGQAVGDGAPVDSKTSGGLGTSRTGNTGPSGSFGSVDVGGAQGKDGASQNRPATAASSGALSSLMGKKIIQTAQIVQPVRHDATQRNADKQASTDSGAGAAALANGLGGSGEAKRSLSSGRVITAQAQFVNVNLKDQGKNGSLGESVNAQKSEAVVGAVSADKSASKGKGTIADLGSETVSLKAGSASASDSDFDSDSADTVRTEHKSGWMSLFGFRKPKAAHVETSAEEPLSTDGPSATVSASSQVKTEKRKEVASSVASSVVADSVKGSATGTSVSTRSGDLDSSVFTDQAEGAAAEGLSASKPRKSFRETIAPVVSTAAAPFRKMKQSVSPYLTVQPLVRLGERSWSGIKKTGCGAAAQLSKVKSVGNLFRKKTVETADDSASLQESALDSSALQTSATSASDVQDVSATGERSRMPRVFRKESWNNGYHWVTSGIRNQWDKAKGKFSKKPQNYQPIEELFDNPAVSEAVSPAVTDSQREQRSQSTIEVKGASGRKDAFSKGSVVGTTGSGDPILSETRGSSSVDPGFITSFKKDPTRMRKIAVSVGSIAAAAVALLLVAPWLISMGKNSDNRNEIALVSNPGARTELTAGDPNQILTARTDPNAANSTGINLPTETSASGSASAVPTLPDSGMPDLLGASSASGSQVELPPDETAGATAANSAGLPVSPETGNINAPAAEVPGSLPGSLPAPGTVSDAGTGAKPVQTQAASSGIETPDVPVLPGADEAADNAAKLEDQNNFLGNTETSNDTANIQNNTENLTLPGPPAGTVETPSLDFRSTENAPEAGIAPAATTIDVPSTTPAEDKGKAVSEPLDLSVAPSLAESVAPANVPASVPNPDPNTNGLDSSGIAPQEDASSVSENTSPPPVDFSVPEDDSGIVPAEGEPRGNNQLGSNQYGSNQFGNNRPRDNQFGDNTGIAPADDGRSSNNQLGSNQYGSNQFGNNRPRDNQFGDNTGIAPADDGRLGNNQLGSNQYESNQFGNNRPRDKQFGDNTGIAPADDGRSGNNQLGRNQYESNQFGNNRPRDNQFGDNTGIAPADGLENNGFSPQPNLANGNNSLSGGNSTTNFNENGPISVEGQDNNNSGSGLATVPNPNAGLTSGSNLAESSAVAPNAEPGLVSSVTDVNPAADANAAVNTGNTNNTDNTNNTVDSALVNTNLTNDNAGAVTELANTTANAPTDNLNLPSDIAAAPSLELPNDLGAALSENNSTNNLTSNTENNTENLTTEPVADGSGNSSENANLAENSNTGSAAPENGLASENALSPSAIPSALPEPGNPPEISGAEIDGSLDSHASPAVADGNTPAVPSALPDSAEADTNNLASLPNPGLESSGANKNTPDYVIDTNQGASENNIQNAANSSYANSNNQYNQNIQNNMYNQNGSYNQNNSEGSMYVVRSEDSYWSIAQRIYGSGEYSQALAEYNRSRVDPQFLTASTQILIPYVQTLRERYPSLCPDVRASSAEALASNAPSGGGTRVYVASQEETIWEISRRELGSILYCSEVYSLNQSILGSNNDKVKAGTRLLLPVHPGQTPSAGLQRNYY